MPVLCTGRKTNVLVIKVLGTMDTPEFITFLVFGFYGLYCHMNAAMHAKKGRGIWVFVAPPIWLVHSDCSGQLIPDSKLSFSSARVGVNPLLY